MPAGINWCRRDRQPRSPTPCWRRASSVATYLTSQGVMQQRLITVGMGETRPIADNGTEEGREAKTGDVVVADVRIGRHTEFIREAVQRQQK